MKSKYAYKQKKKKKKRNESTATQNLWDSVKGVLRGGS